MNFTWENLDEVLSFLSCSLRLYWKKNSITFVRLLTLVRIAILPVPKVAEKSENGD